MYVDTAYRGRGIAKALVLRTVEKARENGDVHTIISVITGGNRASIELHKKLGFTRLGVIPGGFLMKDGSYEDIIPHYRVL